MRKRERWEGGGGGGKRERERELLKRSARVRGGTYADRVRDIERERER